MTHIEQLTKILKIDKVTEDYGRYCDLHVYTQTTADGYEIYVVSHDPSNMDWENDVFYYKPDFDILIETISELDEDAVVYCSDVDEFFPEYEVENFIECNDEEYKVDNGVINYFTK